MHLQPAFRSPRAILIAVGAFLLVGGALILSAHLKQPYTIDVNGDLLSLNGQFRTVADVIKAADLPVGPKDYVWPPTSSQAPASGKITIRQATPVELDLDGRASTLWTHQTDLSSFLSENNINLTPASNISSEGSRVSFESLADAEVMDAVSVTTTRDVIVKDGPELISLRTDAATVGQALIDAGIKIFEADRVEPEISTWLLPGAEISIERATPVMLRLDGQDFDVRTKEETVAGVLAAAGVGLVGLDESVPNLEHLVKEVDVIGVSRVPAAYEVSETPLPFSSRYQAVESLEIDQRTLLAQGSAGTLKRVARIETRGTEAISPTVVGEWNSLPPSDEVIGYGTNIVVRSLDTPNGPLSYWRVVKMWASAYTAADAGKPPTSPGYGITASGRPAGNGVVAIDPNVVPFRSQVYVPGYGVGFAGDTGGAVRGRWIDLGYDEGQLVSWNKYVDVYYLTPVPEADRINYLIPTGLPR